jgi:transposase-like protein
VVRRQPEISGFIQTFCASGLRTSSAIRSRRFRAGGKMRADDEEMARLRRELEKTKAERDILKKAIAFFAKEAK